MGFHGAKSGSFGKLTAALTLPYFEVLQLRTIQCTCLSHGDTELLQRTRRPEQRRSASQFPGAWCSQLRAASAYLQFCTRSRGAARGCIYPVPVTIFPRTGSSFASQSACHAAFVSAAFSDLQGRTFPYCAAERDCTLLWVLPKRR